MDAKKALLYLSIFLAGSIPLYQWNADLFLRINCFGGFTADYFFLLLTALADGFYIALFLLVMYPLRRGFLLPAILAFATAAILVQIPKTVFHLPRPALFFGVENICVLGHVFTTRSFPSGHSASALVLTRYLMEGLPRSGKAIVLTIGILAALSRAYVGVHFPLDIWMGGWIGYWTTDFFFRIMKSHQPTPKRFHMVAFGSSILGIVIAIVYLTGYDEIIAELKNVLIPLTILFLVLFLWRIWFYGKKIIGR